MAKWISAVVQAEWLHYGKMGFCRNAGWVDLPSALWQNEFLPQCKLGDTTLWQNEFLPSARWISAVVQAEWLLACGAGRVWEWPCNVRSSPTLSPCSLFVSPRFVNCAYMDIFSPVTFKYTQEFVSVTFYSNSAFTNTQNITVSQVWKLEIN